MKVDFPDVEFGLFEPHRTIEYQGRKYRAIDVNVTLNDGSIESHTIAERELENALIRFSAEDGSLDDSISYYAENNDDVYYILETITGENIG